MSTAVKPRIIITDPLAQEGIDLLREHFDVDLRYNLSPQELEQVIGGYSAIIVRSGTKVTARILDAGRQLQAVGRAGSGLDNIDVSAARDLGVKVLNCPGANSVAVAEHTMALILALARHLPRANQTMKEGQWAKKQLKGLGLSGRTLGIIGFGRIGREVAKRAQAFGMRIIVNQPRLTPELALEAGVSLYDLDDLLAESDFLTLHIPIRPENMGLISREQFKRMKSSAFLINTARGGIVDEEALLEALEEGEIAGAGIDVFLKEPATNSALARHPNVIASPHIAASTDEAQRNAAVAIAEQIIEHVDVKKGVAATLSLEMVPTELVIPHESFDPKRAERLGKAIERDGLLVNPPIVAKKEGKYIILDGATRQTAFKQLGIPHIVVQVVDPYREDIALHTWYHLISGTSSAELRGELSQVPGLQLIEMPASTSIQSFLQEPTTLAYFALPDGNFWLAELNDDYDTGDSLSVLNLMVHQYTVWGEVARTLMTDLDHLRTVYPEMAALAVFPQFQVDDALNAAIQQKPIPQGITRFIIPGRVLRLNVPIDILQSQESLIAKRRWLDQFVQDKLGRQRVRYYHEPVVLLED